MSSFDCTGIPRCTIEYPLEIGTEEIASIAGPVNTLLKSGHLLGTTFGLEDLFDTLFDIAEEVAGAEACGFLVRSEDSPGSWELRISRRIDPSPSPEMQPYLVAPAAISTHFGKPVSMDPNWGEWSQPICQAWSSRSLVAFPLRHDRDFVGVLVFGKSDSHPFFETQVKLLWALSLQAENCLHRYGFSHPLPYYSFLDPLTHLPNRRSFDSQLEKEVLRSRRSGEPFSLLLFDLDGFKAYNNRVFHESGDIALQEFAGILGECAREVDTLARLGADEFAVILPDSNGEGALAFSRRVVQRFAQHALPDAGGTRSERMSVSVGIASFPTDSFERADLLSKAYRALHLAKASGGGQVRFHDETSDVVSDRFLSTELPLRKIFEASRSVVDMDKFLEILLFTGMKALGAERGSIVAKDPSGRFSLRAHIGFKHEEERIASTEPIRPGSVTSWVMDHQLPLVVSSPGDSPLPLAQKKNGYRTDSFLAIPLNHSGRTLGVLHMTNRKGKKPFSQEDLKSFAPIAAEIAGILDQGIRFRDDLKSFSNSILSSLSDVLELRYPFLHGHSSRVRDISVRIGAGLALAGKELDDIRLAAQLHDVGIVGVPGNLLSLGRSLNDREMDMVRKHPFWGSKFLEDVPGMNAAQRAILEHHENYDGSGYPGGLRGEEISLGGRILSIAEFYDSVLLNRPYRPGVTQEEARRMVADGAGSRFDPHVAATFLEREEHFRSTDNDTRH